MWQRLRGSSDIAAYADTILGLERIDDRLVLSQLKNRDGDFIKPLALVIEDVGDARTEVKVMAEIDAETDKRKQARDLVREALKSGKLPREDLITLGKDAGISERTVTDALKDLNGAGEVTRDMEGHKTVYSLKTTAQTAQPI